MDKSVFMYLWFFFDLYYLTVDGTNIVLLSSVKFFVGTLWSLALARKSCNNIKNSRRAQVSRLLFLATMVGRYV